MSLLASASALFATSLADDAAALCLLEDAAFVDAALSAMVECEVAADEALRFVLLLRQGFSKHYVLTRMAEHWGSAFRPGKLPGVRRRLGHYRLAGWPLLGWLVRRLFGWPGESPSERRLRVMENQTYLLAKMALEQVGAAALPLAPWGGLHRVPLLQQLLLAESQMSPERKAIYQALLQAADSRRAHEVRR